MKILIITNLQNECSEEDVWIAQSFLKDGHEVKLVNKYYNPELEKQFDIFIKRYSWIEDISQFSVGQAESDYETRIVKKDLPRINFDGKFDNSGKHYLSKLYKKGYHVIPTISNPKDLAILPNAERYLVKPVNGYDGFGIIECSREELKYKWNEDYVIQPKVNFDSELQFYFIGNKFEFAQIFKPRKINSHENAYMYTPTKKEIEIAKSFAMLNGKNFNGVQRIDFLKAGDKILLSELEDDSPYMAIEALKGSQREAFINDFKSMTYAYYKRKTAATNCDHFDDDEIATE